MLDGCHIDRKTSRIHRLLFARPASLCNQCQNPHRHYLVDNLFAIRHFELNARFQTETFIRNDIHINRKHKIRTTKHFEFLCHFRFLWNSIRDEMRIHFQGIQLCYVHLSKTLFNTCATHLANAHKHNNFTSSAIAESPINTHSHF